jgi:hypothetical protein
LLDIRGNPNGSLTGIIRSRNGSANYQIRRTTRNGSFRRRDARLVMCSHALWANARHDGDKLITKGCSNRFNLMW